MIKLRGDIIKHHIYTYMTNLKGQLALLQLVHPLKAVLVGQPIAVALVIYGFQFLAFRDI